MVEVTFYRDSRDRLSSFFARGHAEYAAAGEDIVCAAASAILQAAQLGLVEHAGVELDVRKAEGELRVRWPEGARDGAAVRAIAATAELSIDALARQYPEHVRILREAERA